MKSKKTFAWAVWIVIVCALAPQTLSAQDEATAAEPAPEAPAATPDQAPPPPPPPPAQSAPPPPVPSEPLGATAQREHVDSEPPDGYDLSRFPDPEADRSGFTLELGIGLGLTHVAGDNSDSYTEFGLSHLALSLGGFLTRDVALMFRYAGTSWWFDNEGILSDTLYLSSSFVGLAVQYWFANNAFLGGGLGLGVIAANFDDNFDSDTGFMMTGRLGWSFFTSKNHSLALVAEFFPAFYEYATVLGMGLNFQWQLL